MLIKLMYKIAAIGAFLFTPAVALAQNASAPVLEGLDATARAGGLKGSAATPGPGLVAGTIVGYLLAFVGFIFFALMIWGGIQWMTARGNEDQVRKAQDLIKSAVMGISIVFLAYVVTRYVLGALFGAVDLGQ